MKIVRSKPCDALTLTKIAKAAKKYWGYSDEQIEKWKDDLTITPQHIAQNLVFHILVGSKIVGVYSLVDTGKELELEHMWVHPRYIGREIGKRLFMHALHTSKRKKAKMIKIVSDPNAKNFYVKMGAKQVGEEESSIPGRKLPILRVKIEED